MKTSVLISNFNYDYFLYDAVSSVLEQSVKADEIIIVDDGSTDQSVSIIKEKFSTYNNIKTIIKKNEGQASCFNAGYLVSTGDILFFLDSDDIYKKNYLEEVLTFYDANKECDFLFCAHEKFGNAEGPDFQYCSDHDLGYSLIVTKYSKKWIGSVTSTISMRRSILDKILPIPYFEDWRTRADDCLVWGASLVGARKFYMSRPLVQYRIHGSNNFHGQEFNNYYLYKRELCTNRFFFHLLDKMNYKYDLFSLAHIEFKTISHPRFEDLWSYIKFILPLNHSLLVKTKIIFSMLKHFLFSK